MNRVVLSLALVGLLLGGATLWIVRSGGDDRPATPARTAAPPPVPPATPTPDPDDAIETSGAIVTEPSGLDGLVAKMNWCGTGQVGEPYVPDEPTRPDYVGPESIGLHVTNDVSLNRLRADLATTRKPSARRALVRAFLVERTRLASPADAADVAEALARGEPSFVIRARLEAAAAALRKGEPWEPAFDAPPPTMPPVDSPVGPVTRPKDR